MAEMNQALRSDLQRLYQDLWLVADLGRSALDEPASDTTVDYEALAEANRKLREIATEILAIQDCAGSSSPQEP
jgi:hypothetical protein